MGWLEKDLRVSKKGETRHLIGSRLASLSRRFIQKQRNVLGTRYGSATASPYFQVLLESNKSLHFSNIGGKVLP